MSSSSSSSKPRKISPFRFRKPASVNGKLPVQALSSASSFGPSLVARTPSLAGRSSTPGRGRGLPSPNLPTPQKFQLSSNSSVGSGSSNTPTSDRLEHFGSTTRAKENVTVTVQFRPLSTREIQKGDEVAWYADGDTTVRSEYNQATAYAFAPIGLQNTEHFLGLLSQPPMQHKWPSFFTAESEAALVSSLIERKTETKEKLLLQIAMAAQELKRIGKLDYMVVNAEGQLEETVSLISHIIDAEKARSHRREATL